MPVPSTVTHHHKHSGAGLQQHVPSWQNSDKTNIISASFSMTRPVIGQQSDNKAHTAISQTITNQSAPEQQQVGHSRIDELKQSVTQEPHSNRLFTTANDMTVQEPYRLMAAPNVSATQLLTHHPKENMKCYEHPAQQNITSANTILQGQMSTMPQSESKHSVGITHIPNIATAPVQNTISLPHNNVTTNRGPCNQSQQSTSKKEIQPDNFDGGGKTEWSDYVVHFEQCAAWNQKVQMLSIHLRGEAQKLLSSLTIAQLTDYSKLKSILSDRYDPKEKEVTYRCQFRHYRREKGVSVSDYGYHLNIS